MSFSSEQIQVLTKASNDFPFFVDKIFSLSIKNFIKGDHVTNTARFLSQNKQTIRVSARHHFKSFSFYAYFMWKLMFEGANNGFEAHYFSYNSELAGYHINKIKQCIESNPYFEDIIDCKPTAETVLKYTWDNKHYTTIAPHGLVQFKRGIHGDLIFVDDPFQDPENELNPTIIYKINEIFKSNIMDMPKLPDGELHIAGCLTTDSVILMGDGSIKELSDIKKGDSVIGYDFKNNLFKPKKVLKEIDNGRQELLKIKVQSGKKIKATYNHPFLTREGWKEAEKLTTNDFIALPTKIFTERKITINENEAEFLGYILGDGSIGKKGGFGFSGLNESIQNRVKILCEKLNLTYTPRYNDKYQISIGIGRGKNRSNIREKYNIKHSNSYTKEIPNKIFRAPKHTIALFLKGLFETDGSYNNIKHTIGYGSVSKKLAFGVHGLLLQLGIHSNIRLRKNAGKSKKVSIWDVSFVRIEDVNKFLKLSGAFRYKIINEKKIRTSNSSNSFRVPLSKDEKELAIKLYDYHSLNTASLNKLKEYKEFDYLTELDIYWAPIKEITKIGKNKTLNLTVEDGNFIANGILTHNTPQTNEDFFFDKTITSRFAIKIMPAIVKDSVTGEEKALWPEWMSLEELYKKREERTNRIFSREYMCTPVYSTKGFFTKEKLQNKIINPDLSLWKPTLAYSNDFDVFAGFDIGKKTHPSHLSVFKYYNHKLIMIHQKFMDGWPYSNGKAFNDAYPTQLEYLKMIISNFHIRELRYDNTRGEFESFAEQSLLPRQMVPMVFTNKMKSTGAAAFDRLVERSQMEIPNDERLIDQICSVMDNLQAIQTKYGHGDSFWSCVLAIFCVKDLIGFTDDEQESKIRRKIMSGQHSIFAEGVKVPKGW